MNRKQQFPLRGRQPKQGRRRSAFTLLEMLLVLAVVLVLFVLVASSASFLTNNAARAKCVSNLRGFFQGVTSYAADHNGQLPGPTPGGQPYQYRAYDNDLEVRTLVNILVSYLGLPTDPGPRRWLEAPLFQCPASMKAQKKASYYSQHRTFFEGRLYDRPFGYGNQSAGGTEKPIKLSAIERPGVVIALADSAAAAGERQAHGEDRNVLFMDGHVERVRGTAFTRRTMESWELIP